jgi:hypothetical protein
MHFTGVTSCSSVARKAYFPSLHLFGVHSKGTLKLPESVAENKN